MGTMTYCMFKISGVRHIIVNESVLNRFLFSTNNTKTSYDECRLTMVKRGGEKLAVVCQRNSNFAHMQGRKLVKMWLY